MHTEVGILCKILFYTDDIPDKCTLFLMLEVDHTVSHLLWKWNDEERKIGEREWGWVEQVKQKHGKEDGNSNWRSFAVNMSSYEPKPKKKKKNSDQLLLFLIKKVKAKCLIQIYVIL